VENFGPEEHFRGHHGVFFREIKLSLKKPSFVGCTFWASNFHLKVSAVGFAGLSINAHNFIRLMLEILLELAYLVLKPIFMFPNYQ
jgi:hypothetical protein